MTSSLIKKNNFKLCIGLPVKIANHQCEKELIDVTGKNVLIVSQKISHVVNKSEKKSHVTFLLHSAAFKKLICSCVKVVSLII